MQRSIRVVGAPTSIGIRPYDDGTVRRLDEAPGMLPLLDALHSTDGHADWAGATALLPSLLRSDEHNRIVVLSDGADSNSPA